MKRMRWCLVLAVLAATADFARFSIFTLSPGRQTADAADVPRIRSLEAGVSTADMHSGDAHVAGAPLEIAPSVIPDNQPAERGAKVADRTPVTSEDTTPARGRSNYPSPAIAHGLTRSAPPKRAAPFHPTLWPAQLAMSHGLRAWELLSSSADRIRSGSALGVWHEAFPVVAESPHAGNHARPQQKHPVRREAAPPSPPRVIAPRLVLWNPPAAGGEVHFLANEEVHSLSPGETLELTGQDRWLIRFHRGGDLGDAAYSLWPGHYEFVVTRTGWDLVRRKR